MEILSKSQGRRKLNLSGTLYICFEYSIKEMIILSRQSRNHKSWKFRNIINRRENGEKWIFLTLNLQLETLSDIIESQWSEATLATIWLLAKSPRSLFAQVCTASRLPYIHRYIHTWGPLRYRGPEVQTSNCACNGLLIHSRRIMTLEPQREKEREREILSTTSVFYILFE